MRPSARVVGLITARGGSKGLPRKNVRLLAGKPLIAWTVDAALQAACLQRVLLSTDDTEAAEIARRAGAEVPFLRPGELAQDETSHIDVLCHALTWLAERDQCPEYIVTLQPTSPFRTAADIDAAVELALAESLPAVVSVCEISQHPLWAKTISADGVLVPFFESQPVPRRQLLPKAYAPNGAVYVTAVKTLLEQRSMYPAGTRAYVMPPERSIDIDSPWDFHLAELLMRDRLDRASGASAAA